MTKVKSGENSRSGESGGIVLTFVISIVVGAVFGWVLAAVVTYVQPRKYESRAVVQIHPQSFDLERPESGKGVGLPSLVHLPEMDLASELEIIGSARVLTLVAERLDLSSRWNRDQRQVVELLGAIVTTEMLEGTDLVTIRVVHTNANDARDIAEELSESYAKYRNDLLVSRAEKALEALDRELGDQEDLVENRRKVLDTIVQAVGIPYVEGSEQDEAFLSTKRATYLEAEKQLQAAELELARVTDSIDSLDQMEGEDLRQFVAALGWHDNPVERVEGALALERRVLDRLNATLTTDHPAIVKQEALIETLQQQGPEVIDEVRARLLVLSRMANAKVSRLKKIAVEQRKQMVDRTLESHDLVTARQEYETAGQFLQEMKLQHMSGRIALKIPRHPVTVHEVPQTAEVPVYPRVEANLALGLSVGTLVGFLVGLVIFLVKRAVSRQHAAGSSATVPAS